MINKSIFITKHIIFCVFAFHKEKLRAYSYLSKTQIIMFPVQCLILFDRQCFPLTANTFNSHTFFSNLFHRMLHFSFPHRSFSPESNWQSLLFPITIKIRITVTYYHAIGCIFHYSGNIHYYLRLFRVSLKFHST